MQSAIPAHPPRAVPWKRRLARALFLLAAIFVLAAGAIVVSGLHDVPGKADLAVVLGNEVQGDGHPSPRLAARLDAAWNLYQAGQCRAILVSGGVEANGYDEARVMAGYLAARGVPPDVLLQDNRGVDTYSTARNTRSILRQHGWKSVCVVTQYYHVPRSRLAMRRFGISPVYSYHARYFEWHDLFSICREVAGWVKYSLRSYDVDPRRVGPGVPTAGSRNSTPLRRRAWQPPGRLILAGPAALSSRDRTASTS